MPKLIDPNIKKIIRQRYATGESYCQLAKEFGLFKSSVYYIVKDIICLIPKELRDKKRSERIKRSYVKRSKEEQSRVSAIVSAKLKAYYKGHEHRLTPDVIAKSAATHTALELQYKPFLESIFGKLEHRNIAGKWFDFVNDSFIIETTEDYGKGVSSASSRFALLGDDKRKRLLFCKSFYVGEKRLSRLTGLGVEVYDIEDIRLGRLGDKINDRKNVRKPRAMKHGTLTCSKHCKCAECVEAKNKYSREYKAKRRALQNHETVLDARQR